MLFLSDLTLIIFIPFYQQVVIYTTLCIVSGFYYGTIISTNKEAMSAHTSDMEPRNDQGTQTIRQAATYPRFYKIKQTKKIQDLKNTIRERTKELTSHIQHYCNTTKLPGPRVDPNDPNEFRMFYDFVHSFLYCSHLKVNPSV